MIDLLIRVLLIGLAGWRVASLFVQEDGPWAIFARIREAVGLLPGEAPPPGLRGFLCGLLGCVWCLSVWTVPAMDLVWQVSPHAVGMGAAMAVAVWMQRQVQ